MNQSEKDAKKEREYEELRQRRIRKKEDLIKHMNQGSSMQTAPLNKKTIRKLRELAEKGFPDQTGQ